MRDIHRHADIREMEPIAQPDQRKRDDVMTDQLFEILPRLLQLQTQHNRLLRPVARLQEIIRLKHPFMTPVRESLKHPRRVKIPHWRPRHHVQAQWAKDSKIDRGVDLFHKAVLLRAGADPAVEREGAQVALHEELAGEGEDDDVEGDEGEVEGAFAVVGAVGVGMVGE